MSIHSHAAPILIYLSLRMSKNEFLSSELDETFSNIASTQQTWSVKLTENFAEVTGEINDNVVSNAITRHIIAKKLFEF